VLVLVLVLQVNKRGVHLERSQPRDHVATRPAVWEARVSYRIHSPQSSMDPAAATQSQIPLSAAGARQKTVFGLIV